MTVTKKQEIKATKQKYIFSYETQDGEIKFMYRLSLGIDELTRKPRNTTGRGFDTIAEALEAREVRKAKFEARKKANANRPILYRDLATLWLEDYKETVEPSTFDKTAGMFKNHILPIMGDLEFEDITAYDCRIFVRAFSKRVKVFHKLINYASLALGHAVLLGYLSSNPFDVLRNSDKKGITAYTKSDSQPNLRNYLLVSELNSLLDFLENEGNFKVYTFFRFLAFSGCRKGEALALTWDDIDFVSNQVTISKAVSSAKSVGLYQTGTKGDKATLRKARPVKTRRIALDDETIMVLKEWQSKQKDMLKISNIKYSRKKQLVFQNTENKFIYPTQTERWLSKARKTLSFAKDVKFTPHILRHTHATICSANGVPLIDIQHRLGHSDLKTTSNYYVHATEQSDLNVCNTFATALLTP